MQHTIIMPASSMACRQKKGVAKGCQQFTQVCLLEPRQQKQLAKWKKEDTCWGQMHRGAEWQPVPWRCYWVWTHSPGPVTPWHCNPESLQVKSLQKCYSHKLPSPHPSPPHQCSPDLRCIPALTCTSRYAISMFRMMSVESSWGSSSLFRMEANTLARSAPRYMSRALRRSARNFSLTCVLKKINQQWRQCWWTTALKFQPRKEWQKLLDSDGIWYQTCSWSPLLWEFVSVCNRQTGAYLQPWCCQQGPILKERQLGPAHCLGPVCRAGSLWIHKTAGTRKKTKDQAWPWLAKQHPTIIDSV